jgi:hypothetical protein
MKYLSLLCLFLISLTLQSQNPSFSDGFVLLPSGKTSDHAVGVADMTGDGLDDIIRMQSVDLGPNTIQNIYVAVQGNAGETFTEYLVGAMDVAGTGSADSWGLSIGDYDQNGRNDLSTGGFYNGVYVFMSNEDNSDYTELNYLDDEIYVQSMSNLDIDNDGLLDIFICDDVDVSQILTNIGGGNFEELPSGLVPETDQPSDDSGNYGSCFMDVDNNGFCDLYIAKCRQGVSNYDDPRRINLLFMNNGDGTWTSEGAERGVAIGWQSWSADFGDYDNDGDLDLFVGNHDAFSQLFENDGTGYFEEVTEDAEIDGLIDHLVIQSTWADFNNDGLIDIITMGNGDHKLVMNDGDGTFTIFDNLMGNFPTNSYALGDLNNDGFIDLYVTANGYGGWGNESWEDRVYLNDGNDNHYIKVLLEGVDSNINGVGARVEIYGPWGVQIRDVKAGESYGINNTFTQHFGLGAETMIDQVTIHWPSGTEDNFYNVEADQTLQITEGSGPITGLSEESANAFSFSVTPNPVVNTALIQIEDLSSLIGKDLVLEVFDISGKQVAMQRLVGNISVIDLGLLTSGTYIMNLVADGSILSTSQMVKE